MIQTTYKFWNRVFEPATSSDEGEVAGSFCLRLSEQLRPAGKLIVCFMRKRGLQCSWNNKMRYWPTTRTCGLFRWTLMKLRRTGIELFNSVPTILAFAISSIAHAATA